MGSFALTPRRFAYRHVATTFYQLQRGFRGRRQHAWIHEFLSVFLVLSLFYNLQKGSNGFISEKTILILYQGSRGGPLFSRGGGSTYSRGGGPNANVYRNPYNLLFSRGVRTHYPPPGPNMGNVII